MHGKAYYHWRHVAYFKHVLEKQIYRGAWGGRCIGRTIIKLIRRVQKDDWGWRIKAITVKPSPGPLRGFLFGNYEFERLCQGYWLLFGVPKEVPYPSYRKIYNSNHLQIPVQFLSDILRLKHSHHHDSPEGHPPISPSAPLTRHPAYHNPYTAYPFAIYYHLSATPSLTRTIIPFRMFYAIAMLRLPCHPALTHEL